MPSTMHFDGRLLTSSALSLEERCALEDGAFEGKSAASGRAPHRAQAWFDILGGDGEEGWLRRLRWDGVPARKGQLVLECPLPAVAEAAAWVRWLGPISNRAPARPIPAPASGEDVPFGAALAPYRRAAWSGLLVWLDRHPPLAEVMQRWGPQALDAIDAYLLQRLLAVLGPCLAREFAIYRLAADGSSVYQRYVPHRAGDDRRYRRFCERAVSAPWLGEFWHRYPVAARLAATVLDQFVATTTQLATRLAEDTALLRTRGIAAERLRNATVGLSDPHRGGQTVAVLEFAEGPAAVYKPRDIGPERGYGEVVAAVRRRRPSIDLRPLWVVPREGYGWMEFCEAAPNRSRAEVESFYRRAGCVLAFAYVLGATDLHSENLIAAGPVPQLVDLEAVLQPATGAGESSAAPFMQRSVDDSVMKTGLLPYPRLHVGGEVWEVSALGFIEPRTTGFREVVWAAANTDRMARRQRRAVLAPHSNVVRLGDAVVEPEDHLGSIEDGFRDAYRAIRASGLAIGRAGGPLDRLAAGTSRVFVRPTADYYGSLQAALEPAHMRNGLDFDIATDALARRLLATDARPAAWGLLAGEKRALWRLDVPAFAASRTRAGVRVEGEGVAADLPGEDGGRLAIRRMRAMCDADERRQIACIRASLASRRTLGSAHLSPPPPVAPAAIGRHSPAASDLVAEARRVGDALLADGLPTDGGALSWVGMCFDPELSSHVLRPLATDFHSGSTGVAFFLAALAHVTGTARYAEAAVAGFADARDEIARAAAGNRRGERVSVDLGGLTGAGGTLFALVHAARWLDRPELVDSARALLAMVTPEMVEQDDDLDVVSGSAGLALALSAVASRLGGAHLRSVLGACTAHLIGRAVDTPPAGGRGWPSRLGPRILTGLSHGTAGIALALARAHAVEADPRIPGLVDRAVRSESAMYDSSARNWPNLVRPDQPIIMTTWCHGAAGIALARAGMPARLRTAVGERDLRLALATTLEKGADRGLDHLCCGNLGRASALLECGRLLDRPDLVEAARSIAGTVLRTKSELGGFCLFGGPHGRTLFPPGLFQGASGVGYSLLRFTAAELPCVLTLGASTAPGT